MRRGLRFSLALLSCCFLLYLNGCGPEAHPGSENQSADKAPSPGQDAKPVVVNDPPSPVIATPVVPPLSGPVLTPPPKPAGGGGGGGGGGSQGAEEPADTGNPDNDPLGVPERNCADGIDNDGDTFIDCLDSDCAGQSCNDGNGCTLQDTCNDQVCQGTPVNCDIIIGNECAMNTCESISSDAGDDNFKCNSMLDTTSSTFGTCTPDSNCRSRNPDGTCAALVDSCVLGRCIQSNPPLTIMQPIIASFVCEGTDRATLPVADGGCFDGNPCHSFSCEDGECDIDLLDGVLCDDDNACTGNGICNLGRCEAEPLGDCFSSSDCSEGSTCVGARVGTCSESNDPCTENIGCPINTCIDGSCSFSDQDCEDNTDCETNSCSGVVAGTCSCSDSNDCTTNDLCDGEGACTGTTGTQACEYDSDCQSGSCNQQSNLCECSDGNDCTASDSCNGYGECTGSTVGNTCITDMTCPIGSSCVGVVAGTCSIAPNYPCYDNAGCSPGICVGFVVGACSCDDDIGCTTNTCSNGNCTVASLENDECVTDEDPCTTQICTETGCKTTLMDGQMICDIALADYSETLNSIVTEAGIAAITCTIGRLTCDEGDAGSCGVDPDYPAACNEASLENVCTVASNTPNITPEVAAAICAELSLPPTR